MLYEFKQGDAFKSSRNSDRSYLLMEKDPMVAAYRSIDYAAGKETDSMPEIFSDKKLTDEEVDEIFISNAKCRFRRKEKGLKRQKNTFREPLMKNWNEEEGKWEIIRDTSRHDSRKAKQKGKADRDCGKPYHNCMYHQQKETETFCDMLKDTEDITREQAYNIASSIIAAKETVSYLNNQIEKEREEVRALWGQVYALRDRALNLMKHIDYLVETKEEIENM